MFYRTFLASLREHPSAVVALLVVATGSLVWSNWQACSLIPSHRTPPLGYVGSGAISRRIQWPALAWVFLAPMVVNAGIVCGWHVAWVIPACYAGALLGGYGMAWITNPDRRGQGARLYRQNASRWLYATACSSVLTVIAINLIEPGGLLYAVAAFKPAVRGPHLLIDRETALGTFGPLWFMGTHILHTTFYVGFRREALYADLDREWLGRLSGVLLLLGSGWTVFALACLIMPVALVFVPSSDVSQWSLHIAAGGTVSTVAGAVAAWIGKQAFSGVETYAVKASQWTQWLPSVLSVVFAVGVLGCSSSLVQEGLGSLASWWRPTPGAWLPALGMQLGLAAMLLSLAYCFGRVNVNRYSMHALYRNRLTRAFLGSARRQRQPDPFTGFDPADSPRLMEFAQATAGQRLFPVINMTLNVTTSSNAALAERKAEAFTATPLFCGSAALRHPSQTDGREAAAGAFVATSAYAGMESLGNESGRNLGPHLGSMLTISGAALSPNWGYHSSRLTAFLMTLFNVRLGVWLPNPAKATPEQLQLSKPANSETALFNEMLGVATDTSQAIYLSDGGHFENLGVYEMLRRQCHCIIVIDAGQDGDSVFDDLGNVIRKARIDFDTEIMMRPMRIYSRKDLTADKTLGATALGVAWGEIAYPGMRRGRLLYLKPSFLPAIPADVRAYGSGDQAFPNDATLQQWFTESQFESYRALGRWQMDQIEGASLDAIFRSAERAVAGG